MGTEEKSFSKKTPCQANISKIEQKLKNSQESFKTGIKTVNDNLTKIISLLTNNNEFESKMVTLTEKIEAQDGIISKLNSKIEELKIQEKPVSSVEKNSETKKESEYPLIGFHKPEM